MNRRHRRAQGRTGPNTDERRRRAAAAPARQAPPGEQRATVSAVAAARVSINDEIERLRQEQARLAQAGRSPAEQMTALASINERLAEQLRRLEALGARLGLTGADS